MDATHESSVCSAALNCSSSTVFGLSPVDARHDLPEIIEQRYGRRSTIISQFPVDKWHGLIGDPPTRTPSWTASFTTLRIVLTDERLRKKRKPIASEKTS